MPTERALALTVSEAVPDALRFAVPSALVPAVKVTAPVGMVVPLAGLTVTASCVEPVVVIEEGVAVRAAIVAVSGTVTVTVTDAEEVAKDPVGA